MFPTFPYLTESLPPSELPTSGVRPRPTGGRAASGGRWFA